MGSSASIEQVLERVCHIPADLHRSRTVSFLTLLEQSGYLEMRAEITRERLAQYVSEHSSVVSDWVSWSEDKRISQGWVFQASSNGHYVVHHFPKGEELIFTESAKACAEFILKEISGASNPRGVTDSSR